MKPILPTEGITIGGIVPAANQGLLDPSTGQEISVIKFGKQSSQGSDINGCAQPEHISYTPSLETPVTK